MLPPQALSVEELTSQFGSKATAKGGDYSRHSQGLLAAIGLDFFIVKKSRSLSSLLISTALPLPLLAISEASGFCAKLSDGCPEAKLAESLSDRLMK